MNDMDQYLRNPWKVPTPLGRLYAPLVEIGENTVIRFELHDQEDSLIKVFETPHALQDGISQLYLAIEELTGQKHKAPLSKTNSFPTTTTDKLKLAYKCLSSRDSNKNKNELFSIYQEESTKTIPERSYFKIEDPQLSQLESYCEANKISLNSLLFYVSAKSFHTQFPEQETVRWMIPTNVRHKQQHETPGGVFSSYFFATTSNSITVSEGQRLISEKLKSGEHWGNYYLGLMYSKLPNWIIRKTTLNDFRKKTTDNLASFSNIGTFSLGVLNDKYWVVYPTVRLQRPIGVVAIQWNRTLTMSLQMHPSIRNASERIKNLQTDMQTQLSYFCKGHQ